MNDRVELARHEAAHVVVARSFGAERIAVHLSEDSGSGVTNFDPDSIDVDAHVEVSVAGYVGFVLDEAKRKGADVKRLRWRTIAEPLVTGSLPDAKAVRRALFDSGIRMTKEDAIEYVAGICEVVAGQLTEARREWDATTREVLDGELTPTRPGGHFTGHDGRPVYFAASPEPMRPYDEDSYPDADPFIEPPKPKRPLRLLRDSKGRLLGIGGGDES